jgi:hypothetical protein
MSVWLKMQAKHCCAVERGFFLSDRQRGSPGTCHDERHCRLKDVLSSCEKLTCETWRHYHLHLQMGTWG